MAIESVFVTKFKQVVQTCHQSHVRTAFFTGTAYSVGQGMNTLAQALILYIGALLINAGRYQFGQMIQVLSLVLFSVTFAAQTMSYGMLGSARDVNSSWLVIDSLLSF